MSKLLREIISTIILSALLSGNNQKYIHIHFEIPNKVIADYENK